MAELTFKLYDGKGGLIIPEKLLSYELVSEVSAACDGLRLRFLLDYSCPEIVRAEAYNGDKKIFNGFVDRQVASVSGEEKSVFIYARSSAAVLVDNEALPSQYHRPSARQLWFHNAREFGFGYALPNLACENDYYVSKGTSCFGAINNFFSMLYGAEIYVDSENVLRCYEKSGALRTLDGCSISKAEYIINRSNPISQIDYKINSSDKYCYHLKSRRAESGGISRRRLINLSALPPWQREAVARQSLEKSLQEMYVLQLEIEGTADFALYDRVLVNIKGLCENAELLVYETVISKGTGGEKTAVKLRSEQDGGLINYVAQ